MATITICSDFGNPKNKVSPTVSLSLQEASIASYPYPSEGRQNENHNHRKLITWTTALSNSMKLWAMPCRATQDGQVMVESSDKNVVHWRKEWQTTSVFLPWDPINSIKRQKDMTLKDEIPWSVGAQYATWDQWRNNSRNNEDMEPKQNQQLVVDVTISKFRLKLK